MQGNRLTWRKIIVGTLKLVALTTALATCFLIGTHFSQLQFRPRPLVLTFDLADGFPRPDAPRAEDPRGPEPQAVAARAQAIRRTADIIRGECQAAGGDWARWQHDTEQYRATLKSKVDALKDLDKSISVFPEALAGRDSFPLFEFRAPENLRYLIDPSSFDSFGRDRPVVIAERWLRSRGIDLIYAPIPKMTEVYIEEFVDPCPADGIIAPHVRRSLLDLLEADVEVVDVLPLLRCLRNSDAEYLYNTADSHWAPRAMRIVAKEVADRIARYNFGARARYGLPITTAVPGPFILNETAENMSSILPAQDGWNTLTAEQKKRAARAQTTTHAEIRMVDGSVPPDDPSSPVLITGNSYVLHFREQLVKEMNLLVHSVWGDNWTTHAFGDFLRDKEHLAHCRVVVWISTAAHMTRPHPVILALGVKK